MLKYKKIFSISALQFIFCVPVFSSQPSDYEKIPENESYLIQNMILAIKSKVTNKRDAHPKDHGCVDNVKVTIMKSSDPDLQKGIFSTPGQEFSGIIRFSSGSSNPQSSDKEPGGQGLALKILLPESEQARVEDIDGEKFFLDKKYYKSFDILTINGLHEFMVATVADYPEFFTATEAAGKAAQDAARSGASPEEIAKASFKALDDQYFHLNGQTGKKRPVEAALMGRISSLRTYDITDTSYQSWTPSLLADSAVKYQIRPCQDRQTNNPDIFNKFGINKDDPNFLRSVLKYQVQKSETCFILAVQKHLKDFPTVEDATAPWSIQESAYIPIAQIIIPQKEVDKEFTDGGFCETLSFNPGHSTPEHRPIGGIQRARKLIYAAIETKRNSPN